MLQSSGWNWKKVSFFNRIFPPLWTCRRKLLSLLLFLSAMHSQKPICEFGTALNLLWFNCVNFFIWSKTKLIEVHCSGVIKLNTNLKKHWWGKKATFVYFTMLAQHQCYVMFCLNSHSQPSTDLVRAGNKARARSTRSSMLEEACPWRWCPASASSAAAG